MLSVRREWNESLSKTTPGRMADVLMAFGPFLCANMSQSSKTPVGRVTWLALHFFWAIPSMALCLVPMLILIGADIVIETWRGDF